MIYDSWFPGTYSYCSKILSARTPPSQRVYHTLIFDKIPVAQSIRWLIICEQGGWVYWVRGRRLNSAQGQARWLGGLSWNTENPCTAVHGYSEFQLTQNHRNSLYFRYHGSWVSGDERAMESTMFSQNITASHHNAVIMSAMASQIQASPLLAQPFVGAQFKENTKAPRHWPLRGNPPLTGGFPDFQVTGPHKGPVTRKIFPFYDVIMSTKRFHGAYICRCSFSMTFTDLHAVRKIKSTFIYSAFVFCGCVSEPDHHFHTNCSV